MPQPILAPDLEPLVAPFDKAWQNGGAPRIEDHLPQAGDLRRAAALTELIKIDLERRWRNPRESSRPRLEEYAARFPELGGGAGLSLELIAEEYWVRCLWGDKPSAGEYLARFAQHGVKLRERLARVDQEVARETAPASSVPHTPVAPEIRNATSAPHAELLNTMRRLALLTPEQLGALNANSYLNARALARDLLQRGWLTPLQANLLLQNRSADLLVGPYLLFEKIGQGGAGDVYKARHQHMERIVALKVIKKKLVSDPEVMARFVREVKVVSQLGHPNVVQAHDAGPHGANFFLAMEYVEGTDLARLVKERGPLAAELAREYVRQAALGLQHIHERGLIHRDIKPSNLMLVHTQGSAGQIKILDLGLARLRQPLVSDAAGQVTGPGAMMIGTLDYMAPEQAIDFASADIRADIYSLGCTLYYLLTGRPPFPDCTVAEKLLRHQQAEPTPVEQQRNDLPANLGPVLQQMMAKRPAERFQTPGEVATALAAPSGSYLPTVVGSHALVPAPVRYHAAPPVAVIVLEQTDGTRSKPWQRLGPWLRSKLTHRRQGPAATSRRWRKVIVAGISGLILVAAVLLWMAPRGGRSSTVYVAALPELAVGPGTFSKDGFAHLTAMDHDGRWVNDDRRLSVDGKLVPNGLFMFPFDKSTAYARFRLGKEYKLLETVVSINDSSNGCTPLTFTVFGDGKKLWESRPVSNRKERQDCAVDIAGVDILELAVTCPGKRVGVDSGWSAHAVWLDPVVRR